MRALLERVSLCIGLAVISWGLLGCATAPGATHPGPEPEKKIAEAPPVVDDVIDDDGSRDVSTDDTPTGIDRQERAPADRAPAADTRVSSGAAEKIRGLEDSLKPLNAIATPANEMRSF